MIKTLSFLSMLSIGFLMTSCSTANTNNNSGQEQTINMGLMGTWNLTSIQLDNNTLSKDISSEFPNKTPNIILEPVSKSLTGNGGCNNFFGKFEVNQNKIKIGDLGSTKMFCDGVEENQLFKNLNAADNYKIEKQNTLMFYQGDKLLLVYTKK